MPATPMTMPGTSMPHTMAMHMPTPSTKAPTMPSSTAPTALPLMWTAGLPAIFRRTSSKTSRTTAPTVAITTQG